MKLDTMQRDPGSPPEELVPSRYALRVGDLDVLVVSDGVLPLPTSTLATKTDPSVERRGSRICSFHPRLLIGP